jgi:hypothetical protein
MDARTVVVSTANYVLPGLRCPKTMTLGRQAYLKSITYEEMNKNTETLS